MIKNNEQFEIIVKTLQEKGAFAISDIEKGNELSRSSISKNLRDLLDEKILLLSPSQGAAARYRLAVSEKALNFLFSNIEKADIDTLAKVWGIGVASAKKYVKSFVDGGVLIKQGLPPNKIIYYFGKIKNDYELSEEQKAELEKNYVYVTPDGQLLRGERAFLYWALNKSGRKDIKALAQEYLDTRKRYYSEKNKIFLIDATDKLEQVFGSDTKVKKLFHRDFDAIPVFGKSYLGQIVRIAKSGRANTPVMVSIVEKIQDSIKHLITQYGIDAVGFIPPTVMRKTQLMTFLARRLDISLPLISLAKTKRSIQVQQKSLKRLEDRVLNASSTILASSDARYDKVLLIDDVTGSGATINETAKKIIEQGIAREVYGFTITGSAKAGVFEVISEA